MEFKIMASSVLEVGLNDAGNTILKGCTIDLDVSNNLDKASLVDDDANFSKNGFKAVENCFVQGLVAVILGKSKAGLGDFESSVQHIVTEINRALLADIEMVKTSAVCVRDGFEPLKN